MYCMEYMEENLHEWLGEELEVLPPHSQPPACFTLHCPSHYKLVQGFGEDDYIILDCPGQIELFTHIPVLRTLVDYMKNGGWNVCAVYCLDSHFITDSSKFIAGCFQAMSAMVALEVPHLNVLTKVDLMPEKVLPSLNVYIFLTCMDCFAAATACVVNITGMVGRFWASDNLAATFRYISRVPRLQQRQFIRAAAGRPGRDASPRAERTSSFVSNKHATPI